MLYSKYNRDLLEPIIKRSLSIGQVLTELGLRRTGGNYRMVHARIRILGIDTSHFRGQGWSRGETAATHPSVAKVVQRATRRDDEVFTENSPVFNGYRLIRRLVKRGWPYRCAECGLHTWRGKSLHLHLDHLNGTCNDNRYENLRMLCPNCHSQTKTYCRKKH